MEIICQHQLFINKFTCLYKLNYKKEQKSEYHRRYYLRKKENDENFLEKIKQKNKEAYIKRKQIEAPSAEHIKFDYVRIHNGKIRLFWN